MCGISAYVSTCKAHSSLAKCLQGMLLAAIPFIIRNVTCRHVCVGGASNTGGAVLRHFFDDEQIAALTPRLRPDVPAGLDYYPLLRPGASITSGPRRLPAVAPASPSSRPAHGLMI